MYGSGIESSKSAFLAITTRSEITPPLIDSVLASETSLQIVFSEPLDSGAATDISNYTATG